ILVAQHDTSRRVEDRAGVLGNAFLVLLCFRGGLSLGKLCHRLFQHLWMRDEIILDDGLDLAALGVGEALRGRNRRHAESGERNQGRGEQAERAHLVILWWSRSFKKVFVLDFNISLMRRRLSHSSSRASVSRTRYRRP